MIRLAPLILLTTASLVQGAELVTLAGLRVSGPLAAVTPQGVTVNGATTPLNQVASVNLGGKPPAAWPRHDLVELVDGSRIRVADFKVKGRAVELKPLAGGVAFELPLNAISTLARNADDPESLRAFQAIVAARGKRDLFVVKQSTGLNPLAGTVVGGNGAGDALTFESEAGRRLNLKLSRATGGLVFNQPPRDVVPPTLCRVADAAGNTLVAQSVQVESGKVIVITLAGCVARYDSQDRIEKLDFARGNVRYLADLGGRVELPPGEDDGPLGKLFPVRSGVVEDKAIGGGAIMLGGKPFARGVTLPPGAAIAYPLNGQFREFRAAVGVQDRAGRSPATMRLRVELDGRPAFDEVFESDKPPRELAINVRDARELRISAGRAGAALDGDQLNLADARVQK